jgi:predicted phosphodiesterase
MIAILSDIHSNKEALDVALDTLAKESISDIYCTGDLVEYPEDANEVIRMLQQNKVKCVMGNNDLAYLEQLDCSDCATEEDGSSKLPTEELILENLDYLENLPDFISEDDFYLVHGLPPYSFLKYIDYQSDSALIKAFGSFSQTIAFVGHTHEFKVYELTVSGEIKKHKLSKTPFDLNSNSRYIINVGSIGCPRDLENEAGCILYDPKRKQIIRKSLQIVE